MIFSYSLEYMHRVRSIFCAWYLLLIDALYSIAGLLIFAASVIYLHLFICDSDPAQVIEMQ